MMLARVIDMEPGMRFACGGAVHELVGVEARPAAVTGPAVRVLVRRGPAFTVDRLERFPVFGWRG